MKVRADQIRQQLSKKIPPVFLVTGDEPLIIEECCDSIRSHLKSNHFDEREVLHVETGFKWEYFLQCANALSLFAENRLIEIRLASNKINKAAGKIIEEYIKFAPQENVLLIIADKLDAASKKSGWYKAIDNSGCIIEVWPIESQQLPQWLKQQASDRGIALNPDAVQLLCERVEGNLLAAKQELDKLQLLQSGTQLTAQDILAAVSDSSRYDVFALIDAILLANPERSLKILNVLKQEGVEATIILWALSREIRLLHTVKIGLDQGLNYENLSTKHRIWGKKKNSFRQTAIKQNTAQLESLLRQCSSADLIIKGMEDGDIWLTLSDMTLKLAGSNLGLHST